MNLQEIVFKVHSIVSYQNRFIKIVLISNSLVSRPFEMTKISKLSLTGAAFPSKFEFARTYLTSKPPHIYDI